MRKYGIKEGTPTKGGRLVNNFEWTMCSNLFQYQLNLFLTWEELIHGVPKDLK